MIKDPYSPLLGFAMINLIIGCLMLLVTRYQPGGLPKRVMRFAAMLVIVSVLLALVSHWYLGHPVNAGGAMTIANFVKSHPAPFVTGVSGLVLLILSLYRDAA